MAEAKAAAWALEGIYAEACNCKVACPCVWLNPPTEGTCKLLVAWHIDMGHFDGLQFRDVNVALACFAPGDMTQGGWRVALYLDDKASAEQQDALTQIFAGKAGGHPAVLMSFVGEVLGVKSVPIRFESEGRRSLIDIADFGRIDIEAIKGIDGSDASVTNPPLCVVPSHPSIVAKSRENRYKDFDLSWQVSERNGFFSPFRYHP